MAQGFLNSLYISIPATVMPIMIAAFAAYAFAWMGFPGRQLLFVLVIGTAGGTAANDFCACSAPL